MTKTYTISKLARGFGLSRSALLYYDRIGLLPPSGRTPSGYRYYTEEDQARLDQICTYRRAGLTIEDIRTAFSAGAEPYARVFEKRLREIGAEIRDLKNKQRILLGMLRSTAVGGPAPMVDKSTWVEMLRVAGMDDDAMGRWHAEFERRAPEAHNDFLISLGIPENEVLRIRTWSRGLSASREETPDAGGA